MKRILSISVMLLAVVVCLAAATLNQSTRLSAQASGGVIGWPGVALLIVRILDDRLILPRPKSRSRWL
jgi:hypothetical protein